MFLQEKLNTGLQRVRRLQLPQGGNLGNCLQTASLSTAAALPTPPIRRIRTGTLYLAAVRMLRFAIRRLLLKHNRHISLTILQPVAVIVVEGYLPATNFIDRNMMCKRPLANGVITAATVDRKYQPDGYLPEPHLLWHRTVHSCASQITPVFLCIMGNTAGIAHVYGESIGIKAFPCSIHFPLKGQLLFTPGILFLHPHFSKTPAFACRTGLQPVPSTGQCRVTEMLWDL